MSDKLDKVLQIRLSSREQEMIKRAFVGTNVSNMVRMYLITEAEKILENFEMEEVDDFDKFRKPKRIKNKNSANFKIPKG